MRRTRAARCRHALLTEHVLDGHFGDGREPGAGRVALVGSGARTLRRYEPAREGAYYLRKIGDYNISYFLFRSEGGTDEAARGPGSQRACELRGPWPPKRESRSKRAVHSKKTM